MDALTEEHIQLIWRRLQPAIKDKDLLNSLLDHYCCIIESQLEAGVDFEIAYNKAYASINPNGAHEIQEELFFLLTIKKQTTMRRIVIASGIVAALLFAMGIVLKFLHMPGASMGIVTGIFFLTFIFLPLLFVMNMRSAKTGREKALSGLSTLAGILISLSVVFLVQHWPGAIILGYLAVGVLLLMFLPLNFINAAKSSTGKMSAIVTSVLVVTGSCLWLTLVATPRYIDKDNARNTEFILRTERILAQEYASVRQSNMQQNATAELGRKLYDSAGVMKQSLFNKASGGTLSASYDANTLAPVVLKDKWADGYFSDPAAWKRMEYLQQFSKAYNDALARLGNNRTQLIPLNLSIFNYNGDKVVNLLNECQQLQMILLQNERALAAP